MTEGGPLEFVVFDADGKEIDSVDPYQSHAPYDAKAGQYFVKGAHGYEYSVIIPEGGRYEIRPWKDR